MIKRTIHLRESANNCLKALYVFYIRDGVKAEYSALISDALEYYFHNVQDMTAQQIEELKGK